MTELEEHLRPRSLWWIAILAMPILGVPAVILAYAWTWWVGMDGRPAEGNRVSLSYEGCEQAWPLLRSRLDDMGLDTHAFSVDGPNLVVATTLPSDARVADRIPFTLAMPGALEVRDGAEVIARNDDLTDASVRLDLRMIPTTLLRLNAVASDRVAEGLKRRPDGVFTFVIDGQSVGEQRKAGGLAVGELEIAPFEKDEQKRMERTAEWAVAVDNGPLPCAVSLHALTQEPSSQDPIQ